MNAPGNPALTYQALLRGINVGDKNVIKMMVQQDCFKSEGFRG